MSTTCYINNKPIRAIIDTGSSVTLIRQNVAQKLGLHSNPTTALMTGIKGSIVAAVGQTSCRLSSDGVGVDITPLIMNYHDIPVDLLVGRDILEHPGWVGLNVKIGLQAAQALVHLSKIERD